MNKLHLRFKSHSRFVLIKQNICIQLSFFLFYLSSPMQLPTYAPRDLDPNTHGSDVCRGSNRPWTRTLDRQPTQGRDYLNVVNTMSGPAPETTQDRTQTRHIHPVQGQKLKFLIPPGIESEPPSWKTGMLQTTPWRRTCVQLN